MLDGFPERGGVVERGRERALRAADIRHCEVDGPFRQKVGTAMLS